MVGANRIRPVDLTLCSRAYAIRPYFSVICCRQYVKILLGFQAKPVVLVPGTGLALNPDILDDGGYRLPQKDKAE